MTDIFRKKRWAMNNERERESFATDGKNEMFARQEYGGNKGFDVKILKLYLSPHFVIEQLIHTHCSV